MILYFDHELLKVSDIKGFQPETGSRKQLGPLLVAHMCTTPHQGNREDKCRPTALAMLFNKDLQTQA